MTGAADVPDVGDDVAFFALDGVGVAVVALAPKQTARNPIEKKAQSPTQNVLSSIDRQYY